MDEIRLAILDHRNVLPIRSMSRLDDVIKWKHFSRYWPFVRGIHRSPVNSTHKGQWRGALMFTLICARLNSWVNNREAGDLRRYRAHYDVIVMDMYSLMHGVVTPTINHAAVNGLLLKTKRHNEACFLFLFSISATTQRNNWTAIIWDICYNIRVTLLFCALFCEIFIFYSLNPQLVWWCYRISGPV